MSFFREEGTIIGRKYKIANKIGSGSFGVVYKGVNIRSNETVAIKIESLMGKSKLLKNEAKICRHLTPCTGISSVRWYGIDQDNSYAVFDLLGVSLDTYMERLKKFSLKTTCNLGMQMITRLEYIHNKGILHRDIKPDNFLMGKEDTETLYVIDFGLSKNYVERGKHMKLKDKKKMTGTVRYASINIHDGIEPSRRDDLISVGYMLVYFIKGFLPWQGLDAATKEEKYNKIGAVKRRTSIEELCKDLPMEIKVFIDYCYGLEFAENPNYNLLFKLLEKVYNQEIKKDGNINLDWDIKSKLVTEINLKEL
jgi:serine/threonine protein kinase